MTDRLVAAQRIAQRALNRIAGEIVTYRDGTNTVNLRATRSTSGFDNLSPEGETIASVSTDDWLIDPRHLVDSSDNRLTPATGATITDAGGAVYTLTPGTNEKPYAWADARQARLRIHTKQTKR